MSTNKKYNVALLFEILINRINESVFNQEDKKAEKYVRTLKEFFLNPKTNINKELRLYSDMCFRSYNDDLLSEGSLFPRQLIIESMKSFKYYDFNKTRGEIDKFFESLQPTETQKEFLAHKVNEKYYKVFKAAYDIALESRGYKNVFEQPVEKAKALTILYEHVRNKVVENDQREAESDIQKITESRMNNAVIKFAISKFNIKYTSQLTESQRKLFNKFMYSKNDKELYKYMLEQYSGLLKKYENQLQNLREDISHDKFDASLQKFNESIEKLEQMKLEDFSNNKKEEVLTLALHQGLIDEIYSLNKNTNVENKESV